MFGWLAIRRLEIFIAGWLRSSHFDGCNRNEGSDTNTTFLRTKEKTIGCKVDDESEASETKRKARMEENSA